MRLLVRAYHVRLVGFARLFTGSRETAEEIAQETFLALYRQRGQVRDAEAVVSWLFTTAKRKAMREMGHRRHQLEELVAEPAGLERDGAAAPQPVGVLGSEQRRLIARALDQLGETDRALVELRYFAELPLHAISEQLHMPMGSVGVKLRRALDKIRRTLEDQGIRLGDIVQ
jgi:RNA polymerase sigma-70 factor (ECF subfamily)